MTIIIFPVQCDVNQATNDTKIKFADNVCLSGSLPVCFLYNILVLNFQAKGNQPQKITLLNLDIMQYSYPDLYIQRCLLKVLSVKKNNENQSIND